MTANDRREPVLEEAELPSEEKPFLLTELLREGLPRPLWRRPKGEEETSVAEPLRQQTTERAEPQFTPTPSTPPSRRSEPQISIDGAWEDHPQAAAPTAPGESIEATELTQALQRIRGLSAGTADVAPPMPSPESAAAPSATAADTATMAEETHTATAMPASSVAAEVQRQPEVPAPDPTRAENHAEPRFMEPGYLRDLETLLRREVERRVVAEMEEQITQHLQKVWKEQVSLTLMRSIALEGIRLREGVAELVHNALPEILQRVVTEELQNARQTIDFADSNP
ncbi:hypothetical protein [Candidatus Igneacidithiobacillus taiwanensis]|uniref:hypothetical protein n=1 Tax=Candidatus Igneacidithiobacillus taiwanensis TaxID=1945924 RepID=UPI00289897D3|nr:hypothetical protein [Candidatus Igneacidithiobacillus taiwanensis]MCE5360102.1 hypothetical protein [Acidithiobacillus sp.]